jgi:hypothetical protein
MMQFHVAGSGGIMRHHTEPKRWQDLGNILLGAWLFISPWILDYVIGMPPAAKNSCLLGLAIVIFAAVAIYIPQIWEEWINIGLGVWMIISPWVLGFSVEHDITTNNIIVGILVAALALWAMLRDKDFKRWWHGHHVT